ncbi:MAG: carboxymuconolactone decarboxylase family protein [Bacteroidia bacterium]
MSYFSFLPAENAVLPDLAFRWPGRYANLLRYTHKLLRGKSELSIAERELIGGYVSGLNSCNFCYSIHSTLADHYGASETLLELMLVDLERSPLDPKLKPIFRYVKKLTENPSRITSEDVDAITAEGWREKTVVDAMSIAAGFAAWNRLMDGSGIPIVPRSGRPKAITFMRTQGYMPWYMAPFFRLWGWVRNPN